MSTNELILGDLAKLLQVSPDALAQNALLDAFEAWDSLAVISTLALLDQHRPGQVTPRHLRRCETIGDILALVQ